MDHRGKKSVILVCCAFLGIPGAWAAPFDRDIPFTQPDGRRITIHGRGDEFYAEFTHKEFPVVYSPGTRSYDYAVLGADGASLASSGVMAGAADPESVPGLSRGIRIPAAARKAFARERFEKWDAAMQTRARWREVKAARGRLREAMSLGPLPRGGMAALSVPASLYYEPTVGTKVGLTLLIDFPGETASVPAAEVDAFMNGDDYTGFGNRESVKHYYEEVSRGNLHYSNLVVPYVRMEKSKSEYDRPDRDNGENAQKLIRDAIAILKARPDFQTEILPRLDELSKDGEDCVLAFNVLYAGSNSGVWGYGLWPHSFALDTPLEIKPGVKLRRYQITDLGSDGLKIGTVCHENGHMLCGYPDLYDYDYDSTGGGGGFCLMGSGNNAGPNKDGSAPVQICAFLRMVSGWTVTEYLDPTSLLPDARLSAEFGSADDKVFCCMNPAADTEYYLIENRQRHGCDAWLPAAGLAIWHVDELGDRDDQSLAYNSEHKNYECTLMQADGNWDFQNNRNEGDWIDLFYRGNTAPGYKNAFSANTMPSSRWWDGTDSGLSVRDISDNGTVMTFSILPDIPSIATPRALTLARVGSAYSCALRAVGGAEPYAWEFEDPAAWPGWIAIDPDTGALTGTPDAPGCYTNRIAVSTCGGLLRTNKEFVLTVMPPYGLPFFEDFNRPGELAAGGWSFESTNDLAKWEFGDGNRGEKSTLINESHPSAAHSAPCNAFMRTLDEAVRKQSARMISPMLDFGPAPRRPALVFWLCNDKTSDTLNDTLTVYGRPSPDAAWTALRTFNNVLSKWTEQTVLIPDATRTYSVAFEGTIRNGAGVHVDDVWIGETVTPLVFRTAERLPDAAVNVPYQAVLEGEGGVGPYAFAAVGALPAGLSLSSNVLSGAFTAPVTNAFELKLTDRDGFSTNRVFTLAVDYPRAVIFRETFECKGVLPAGWSQEYVVSNVSWEAQAYNDGHYQEIGRYVPSVQGDWHALLWWSDTETGDGGVYPDHITRLITPSLDLGFAPRAPRLTFWLHMGRSNKNQDQLRVYWRNAPGKEWALLAAYTDEVPEWTELSLDLPEPTKTYSICFEGNAKYGAGVHLDDVRITDASACPLLLAGAVLEPAYVGLAYEAALPVAGGREPYAWSVSGTLPGGLALDPATGIVSGTPLPGAGGVYPLDVAVTGADGAASTNRVTLEVVPGRRIPFEETFDASPALPAGWRQGGRSGAPVWAILGGGKPDASGAAHPPAAFSPDRNACLADDIGKENLVPATLYAPMLSFGAGTTNAALTFRLFKKNFVDMSENEHRDTLSVLYSTNRTDWAQIKYFENQSVTNWTEVTVNLPNPGPVCFLAFKASARGAWGVCIDDVRVTGEGAAASYLEQWGAAYFPEGYPGDGEDSDGDGLANIWEFAYGLNPTNAADGRMGMTGGILGDYLTLSYRENPDARVDGYRLVPEACTNLLDGSWRTTEISDFIGAPAQSNGWPVIKKSDWPVEGYPSQFMRLRLLCPGP